MRRSALIAALVILAPYAGLAADTVEESVNKAIEALNTSCYEARMTYLSQFDNGELQQVHIIHVAPDLYHVNPVADGRRLDWYYIENALELVNVAGNVVTVMPKRRFSTNDKLTAKFLRDLGSYPGSTMLSGMVGDYDVWVVRQDATTEKPYMITVGLDKQNYFPLFLLVNEADGKRRVYYEMEAIEYKTSSQIRDDWFIYAEDTGHRNVSPRVNELAPQQFDTQGSEEEGYSVLLRTTNALEQLEEELELELPLYPSRLPDGYRVDSITLLGVSPLAEQAGDGAVVYQLEIYGPGNDLLSIFQTRLEDSSLVPGQSLEQADQGFALQQINGWLMAAFGDVPVSDLQWILDGLEGNEELVRLLLEETKARDLIIQQVIDGSSN